MSSMTPDSPKVTKTEKAEENPKEKDDYIIMLGGVRHWLLTVEEMMSDKYKMTPIDPNSEWQRRQIQEASEFFYCKN